MAHLHKNHSDLSLKRQCDLLSLNRSSLYYQAKLPSDEDDILLNQIRDIWERWPFYGYRRIHITLIKQGVVVNRKRVQRLMKEAGIQANLSSSQYISQYQRTSSISIFIEKS